MCAREGVAMRFRGIDSGAASAASPARPRNGVTCIMTRRVWRCAARWAARRREGRSTPAGFALLAALLVGAAASRAANAQSPPARPLQPAAEAAAGNAQGQPLPTRGETGEGSSAQPPQDVGTVPQTAPAQPPQAAGTVPRDPPAQPLRIGTVTVQSEPLFSAEEMAEGGVFRFFNALHVPTRPQLIREFLLFREGEAYDPLKLVESERNLRALDFIKEATITTSPPRDGRLDVTVKTQDAWSTDPDVEFSHENGATVYDFGIVQKNLFGSGSELNVSTAKDTERTIQTIELSTPALFAAYWNADVLWARSSDGGEVKLAVNRPFFSLSNRWTLAVELDRLKQDRFLYQLGDIADVFGLHHQEAKAEFALSVARGERHARRLLLGANLLDDTFGTPSQGSRLARSSSQLPDDRHFRYLTVGYETITSDFVKMDYVNHDLRFEDFNLGLQFAVRLGLSPPGLEASERSSQLRLTASQGWRQGSAGFLLSRFSFAARNQDRGMLNQIGTAGLLYVRRLSEIGRQTLVGRIDYSRGWRLDRDVQFLADGLTGLRAYPSHAYAGNKRLLFNVEDRLHLGREIWKLFAPGFAVFFDAGMAEPEGTPLKLTGIKSDVGAGLRFGVARADAVVLRFDCAYQLNRDPLGHRGLVFSFGSTHAF
jgi:hypothetical protein